MSMRLTWIGIATASLLGSILPAAGRADETLFASNFESNPIFQPPSHNQGVGTVTRWGPHDSVLIEGDGSPQLHRVLRITRSGEPDEVGFRGQFSHNRGYGTYTITIKMAVLWFFEYHFKTTLDFEPLHQQTHPPARFLRLEFLPGGKLRFDENNATRFGKYDENEYLFLTITLNENPTLPSVHVHLHLKDGTPDSIADYNIQKPLREFAQEFGAITMSIGSHQLGQVVINSLVVDYCSC